MPKTISTQPDAAKFRSLAVIILVLICIGIFLTYTQDLSHKAEEIARQTVANEIKHSLAMMLYDYTIKGKPHDLQKFDRENPFIVLAIYGSLPGNYQGVVERMSSETGKQGWYFDKSTSRVQFVASGGVRTQYEMRYNQDRETAVGQLLLVELD